MPHTALCCYYFLLFLAICTIFAIFVSSPPLPPQNPTKKLNTTIQEIISYSLNKQIELTVRNYTCETYPKLNYINEKRKNWVRFNQIYVFSANIDNRLAPNYYLRVVAMIKGYKNGIRHYCQISTKNGKLHHVSEAFSSEIWHKSWNLNDTNVYFHPILISCHIPQVFLTQNVFLSISPKPCQFNQKKMKIIKKNVKPTNFTICIKPLNFIEDVSDRILQWISMNQVFISSNDKFEFYVQKVPNRTLSTLQKLGFKFNNFEEIDHNQHFTNFETGLRWQRRRYEIVSYNDCLYKNLHSKYILPIDIDEVIVPRVHRNWHQLLNYVKDKKMGGSHRQQERFASYTVRNAYYLQHFNNHQKNKQFEKVFFFRDVIRSKFSANGESGKSFIVTQNSLTVFNHYALEALRPGVQKVTYLDTNLAQMNHYRNGCNLELLPQCVNYINGKSIVDEIILRFKKQFYEQYFKLKTYMDVLK